MSLSAWEQQALDYITDDLTGSDPALTQLLASFTELAAGEEMPALEKIRAGSRRPICRPRRRRSFRRGSVGRGVRSILRRLGFRWTALLLWVVISGALIAVGLVLGNGSGQAGTCTVAWPAVCATATPAHGATPATRGAGSNKTPALVPAG